MAEAHARNVEPLDHGLEHPEDGTVLSVFAGTDPVGRRIQCCRSAGTRRTGLLGRKALAEDQGALLFLPGRRRGRSGFLTSIHMIGMKFPVAVAWLDEAGRVVHSVYARRWRPYYASPRPAAFVLEVHPSHLSKFQPGTQVHWEPTPERVSP